MGARGIAMLLLWLLAAGCAPAVRSRLHPGARQPQPLVLPDPEPAHRIGWSVRKTADPCENFYDYACGGWFETLVPPAGAALWGQGLYELDERARRSLWQLLAAAETPPDPRLAEARAFYAACMAEYPGRSEVASLQEALGELDQVHDGVSFMRALARLHRIHVPAGFAVRVAADPAEPGRAALFLHHGGLGLPFPLVYLSGGVYLRMREAYRTYMTETLELVQTVRGEAERQSEQAYAVEKILAELAPHNLDRAPDQTNHVTSPQGLEETSRAAPWEAYFSELGVPPDTRLVLDAPSFFDHFDRVLDRPEALASYLRWQLLNHSINLLPEEARRQHASMLPGSPNDHGLEPRWSMCARTTAELHAGALADAYRRSWPPPGHVEAAKQISRRVSTSLAEMVETATWSDPEAKAAAKRKIASLRWTFDRPAEPALATPILLRPGDHLVNTLALRRQASERWLAAVGGAVLPGPLAVPPFSSVSVYINTSNEAYLPPPMLRRPMLDPDAPAPVNFGAFGAIVGHEVVHAIDGRGRFYDESGRLRNWWPEATALRYEEKASCTRQFYGGFEVYSSGNGMLRQIHYLDGSRTLHENLADIGGLRAAHRAYRGWVAEHPGAAPAVDGFTDEQVFFLAFAQTWCAAIHPNVEIQLSVFDSHAPPRFRVNGTLAQVPEFAQAFSCQPGARMNPAERCGVW